MLRLYGKGLRRDSDGLDGAEEDVTPGVPVEQAHHEAKTGRQHLRGQQHHALDEGAEAHLEDRLLLLGVPALAPTAGG